MGTVGSLINGCLGKHSYDTEAEAHKQLKAVRKKKRLPNFTTMQAYKCHHCPRWHLGHNYRRIVKVQ
jgi:hypothetical protein